MEGNKFLNINKLDRILCVVLTIFGFVFFFVAFGLFLVFLIDSEYTDKYNLPRLGHNPYVNYEKESLQYKLLMNCGFILLFWLQHLILSNDTFKSLMSTFTNYRVYERGVFTSCNNF
jgi:hypothetical protein